MCEFCTKHGEGKKWYLQVKNYSEDLWNDVKRKKVAKQHFGQIYIIGRRDYKFLKFIYKRNPLLGMIIFRFFRKNFIKNHLGQVVTIEDVEKIFEIVNSIVRIPCICRKTTMNKEKRYCFAISVNPESVGMAQFANKSYFKGPDISQFEKFDKNMALEFMKNLEPSGMIHTVWTVLTPFVGFVCNCGSDGCLPLLSQKEIAPMIIKSEYVAESNADMCSGCKKCINVCLFKAIEQTPSKKITIDKQKCYGCGICRSVCKKNAISLLDRLVQTNLPINTFE